MNFPKALFAYENLPIEKWEKEDFEKRKLEVSVLRLDLIHPLIQGNKWLKLRPFLENCFHQNAEGFVSMGGPFSNHLMALAAAGQEMKKSCLFWIRGEKQEWMANPAAKKMIKMGAQLFPLSRNEFRELHPKREIPLPAGSKGYWITVPMGGTDAAAFEELKKFGEMLNHLDFEILALPAATGGTASGISLGLDKEKTMLVAEVLRSKGGLQAEFQNQHPNVECKIDWQSGFHFGGYAKSSPLLRSFCREESHKNRFQLEPIYSGKCFYAVLDLAKKGHFQEGNRILILHTGGIFPWNLQLLARDLE